MAQFCRQMGSKEPYFTLAAVGAQWWTATVPVPWQWPKWFGYKFLCWHAWEGMFCKYEVTYSSMKLFKSVFLNLVMNNMGNKAHKVLHLAYLTKKTANFSPLKFVTLVAMEGSKQLAGCWTLSIWLPSLGCQLSSTRVGNSPWPLQKKVRSILCFHNFFALFKSHLCFLIWSSDFSC